MTTILTQGGLEELQKKDLEKKVFEVFEYQETFEKRISFVRKICTICNIDYGEISNDRIFNLLNQKEVKRLIGDGVDIQLHTHRHRMPFCNIGLISKEIEDNLTFLRCLSSKEFKHFCYPSGQFDISCESILKSSGMKSATTCDPGFVDKRSNFYYLPRFLDGENISQIIFEAEVCGVMEILRKVKTLLSIFRWRFE